MGKYDGFLEDDILNEILDDLWNEENEIDIITDDDITKMILVEYYLLNVPAEEIKAEWELSDEEFSQILKENDISYEELERFKKELFDG